MTLAVRVPATTANLGPGFDALGAAVSRHLVVGLSDPSQTERVVTHGQASGDLPTDDDNLIWRSLVRFCESVGKPVPDVRLEAHNDIPLERGMGSSSSAIVAGLVLGRALTAAPVGDQQLVRLATSIEGHPDNVAPALLGGFVACAVDEAGELVVRRAQPGPSTPVIAFPASRQNTAEARGVLPEQLSRSDAAAQAARSVHVAGALTGSWPVEPGVAGDLLHEPARFQVMPASADLVRELRGRGHHAWLSGAGPAVAVAAVAASETPAIIGVCEAHGFEVHALDWDLSGAVACAVDRCPYSGLGGCTGCPRARL